MTDVKQILGPGVYENFSERDYRLDPCETPSFNYSTAKTMVNESDWHAWKQHPRLGGEGKIANKKMDRGTILHALLLNQPLWNIAIIDAQDYKKKDTQQQRDAAKDAGKLVILKREYDALITGLPTIRQNLRDADVELDGRCEATLIWDCDGARCRTRIDHVDNDMVKPIDIKCTEDANPRYVENHIVDMGYDIQCAAEIEAIETLHPGLVGRVSFRDVFIEAEYPHFVVSVEHSESLVSLGKSRWFRSKKRWLDNLETGIWKGFVNKVIAHAPARAMNREFGESL
jgi:hypothetical protein